MTTAVSDLSKTLEGRDPLAAAFQLASTVDALSATVGAISAGQTANLWQYKANTQRTSGAIPTSDPNVYGQLWSNSGTITISAG